MTSPARREAETKVVATRELLAAAGKAGRLTLVRWTAESSGRMTMWHLPGPWQPPDDILVNDYTALMGRGATLCGLSYPLNDMSNMIEIPAELGIPDDTASRLCGTCLLLAVKPVRLGP